MIDKNLVSYVSQNLNKGFSIQSIQSILINQGYPPQNVYDTINYVTKVSPNTSQESLPQKSSKKIWPFIGTPIGIIVIGLIIFLFIGSSKTISDDEFSQGTNFELKENKEVKFVLDDEQHTIKVNSVSSDSVNLIIQSDSVQVDIKIGEEKRFDLGGDGFYDIQIKLNNIKKGVPELYIKKIHESICTENWDCEDWSSCSEQGSQTRTCTDLNSCGTTKNKPSITQSCTYTESCFENWSCTNWTCVGTGPSNQELGILTRTCVDLNNCSQIIKNETSFSCYLPPVSPENPSECVNIEDSDEKDECYRDSAEDVSICENIIDLRIREQCYSNVAEIKGDLSICEKISDSDNKDICYANVAVVQDDLAICDMILSDERWYCYYFIALNREDVSICETIEDQNIKNICHNAFN